MILEHIGITVSDLDRSIDFYRDVFGFRLLRKTQTSAYLELSDELLELNQSVIDAGDTSGIPVEEDWIEKMSRGVGIRHLGFRVDDLDRALEGLTAQGGHLVAAPRQFVPQIEYVAKPLSDKQKRAARPQRHDYWRIAMIADPDGVMLEILER